MSTLYTYWGEPSWNPYVFKSLVLLFKEGVGGDLLWNVVLSDSWPPERKALKYLCQITKGLSALHNNSIIHGSIKPTSIYLNETDEALIGEISKVELDAAWHTHQLFSRALIGDAMPHTLIYWSPELLKLEKYSYPADIWALGITMY